MFRARIARIIWDGSFPGKHCSSFKLGRRSRRSNASHLNAVQPTSHAVGKWWIGSVSRLGADANACSSHPSRNPAELFLSISGRIRGRASAALPSAGSISAQRERRTRICAARVFCGRTFKVLKTQGGALKVCPGTLCRAAMRCPAKVDSRKERGQLVRELNGGGLHGTRGQAVRAPSVRFLNPP